MVIHLNVEVVHTKLGANNRPQRMDGMEVPKTSPTERPPGTLVSFIYPLSLSFNKRFLTLSCGSGIMTK